MFCLKEILTIAKVLKNSFVGILKTLNKTAVFLFPVVVTLLVLTYCISSLVMWFQYVFVTETVAGPKQKTVHEELAECLKAILRPNMADQLVVGKFLRHSWFFFEVLIKSMAQHLLVTDRIKVSGCHYVSSSCFLKLTQTVVY